MSFTQDAQLRHLCLVEGTFPLASLEAELAAYVSHPEKQEQAFDITTIPKISREQAAAEVPRKSRILSRTRAVGLQPDLTGAATADFVASAPKAIEEAKPASAAAVQSQYAEQLSAVPELQSYGPVHRSSARPIALTESETEYVVTAVKHIYKEHIVFQVSQAYISLMISRPNLPRIALSVQHYEYPARIRS
jgi:coatomer protein complex subunit gamma